MPVRPVALVRILTASLTLLVATVVPAVAQSGKIGVLDTQKVVLQSQAGKTALAPLEAFQKEKEGELETKKKEISDLRTRIAEGQSLPGGELAKLREELETKTNDIRRFQQDAAQEIQRRQAQVLQEIDRQVMPVVNAYAIEQSYSMIFRKFESGLVYVDESIDVTAAIIQRLDAQ